MPTVIRLPQNFAISALYRFTRNIVRADGRPADNEFTFDFSPLDFIDGTGYTALSNTLEWLRNEGVTFRLVNFRNLQRQAISYLDDCGFFHRYGGKALSPDARVRDNTIPCTAMAHANAHGWLEYTFSPWMRQKLRVSHGALGSVRTCAKEIFNNINDHSTLNTGFIHAQYYPGLREVRVTISDFGRGIPNNIRSQFGPMDDAEAIEFASREGITTKSTPRNMGAGLNYLIDTITQNEGRVSIYSFAGSLNCFRDNRGRVVRRTRDGNGSYPGTLVDIALDTRLFVGDSEDRGEVEWF